MCSCVYVYLAREYFSCKAVVANSGGLAMGESDMPGSSFFTSAWHRNQKLEMAWQI